MLIDQFCLKQDMAHLVFRTSEHLPKLLVRVGFVKHLLNDVVYKPSFWHLAMIWMAYAVFQITSQTENGWNHISECRCVKFLVHIWTKLMKCISTKVFRRITTDSCSNFWIDSDLIMNSHHRRYIIRAEDSIMRYSVC